MPSRSPKEFRVIVSYDDEAKVYFVSESDIPGLSLEAETFQGLERAVILAAPELIELNRHKWDGSHEGARAHILYQYQKEISLAN